MQTFQSFLLQEAVKSDNKKPKVLLIMLKDMWDLTNKDLAPLRKVANLDIVQVKSLSQEQLAEKCRGYDHLMLNVDFIKPHPDKMERLDEKFYNHDGIKDLVSMNVDMTDMDYFNPHMGLEKGLLLQDAPNTTTESVAESAITEILLHARGRHLAYNDELKGKNVECRTTMNLKGKVAGIIGAGNIGSRVGEILHGFGMNVMFYDIAKVNHKITPIEKIFKQADVISVHLPTLLRSGKSNVGFINSDLLDKCKGTILINLATDVIVDPKSAAKALKSKKLIGYSCQHNYSPEFGQKYMDKFKGINEFHIAPCSFDSPESRENIKRVWIQNTVSMINGNPQNVWN